MDKDDSEVLTANFVPNQSNIGSDAINTRALPNPKIIIDGMIFVFHELQARSIYGITM